MLVQAFNRMLDEIQASQRERADLLDREQQANRLKDEFLATLSHELRTPLNAIVGWVHLLRRGQLPAGGAKHALERIDRNAHAQARLVQDLLDVSRITSGKLLLDIREMDLATVAAQRHRRLPSGRGGQAGLAGRRIHRHVSDHGRSGSPAAGAVEPDHQRGALHAAHGQRHRVDRARGMTRHRSRCATPAPASSRSSFRSCSSRSDRRTRASTRAHGGLGIGLTIVRRLTEMHGGTVSVASDGPGKGATLTVTLPVRRPVPASRTADAHDSASRR